MSLRVCVVWHALASAYVPDTRGPLGAGCVQPQRLLPARPVAGHAHDDGRPELSASGRRAAVKLKHAPALGWDHTGRALVVGGGVRAEEEAEDDQLEACFCEACCCQEGWARAHCDRGRTAAREDFQRGEDRGVAALGRREAVR